jgi:nitrogen-specific signal transduction histidine kinase
MVHVVRDGQGRTEKLRGLMVDVSERRRLEEELGQAQRMEAIGRLAGGIGHDFNNLLTVIMGQTELLRRRLERRESLDGEVEAIESAAERAAELTSQLVAFSRKQVLQPRVLALNATVKRMGAMLRRVIGERIELVTSLRPRLWHVKADPGRIEQVIVNLALNARDAMPAGGRLTIETGNLTVEAAGHHQRAMVPPGAYVALTVRDTGCGMDAQTQSHIFEPFFTTKGSGRGAGLGLSVVYGIVKQSGGAIRVDSEPGGGSTFTIYLPRVDDPITPIDPRRPTTEVARGSETILVVEDQDEVRDIVLRALGTNGYTVLHARDGVEALAIAAREPGPIHLLVTDVVMPRMNGRELAERLVQLRPELTVLYMSGYTNDLLLHRPGDCRDAGFLPKPFRCDTLARKVRACLDARARPAPART